jgi:creatinine deaminase
MDQATMQALMQAARQEAEQSWIEGGIPIGAVLASEDGTIVARGHNQRIQNGDPTSHGERRSFQGAEQWLLDAGIAVECLDDPACEQLMRRMQEEKPDLWAEDIGEPPAPLRLQP